MSDDRHADDTVFLVAESDFRFYENDCVADWLDVASNVHAPLLFQDGSLSGVDPSGDPSGGKGEQLALPAPPSDDPFDQPEPSASSSWVRPDSSPGHPVFCGWQRGQKPKEVDAPTSPELRQLVQIMNQAQRIGRGNFVWLCWQPNSSKQKQQPSWGTSLVGITMAGAQYMKHLFEKETPDHIDKVFFRWFRDETLNLQNPKKLGASFVFPSVGHFQSHESGCCPEMGVREGIWEQTYLLQGVKPIDPEKKRWLGEFVTKGVTPWLMELKFDHPDCTWLTGPPPSHYYNDHWSWILILRRRHWVDEDSWWVGPGDSGAKKKSPAPGLHGADKWKALTANPDEFPWNPLLNRYEPITRLAEEMVCDWDGWDFYRERSNREWKTRQRSISAYKRRQFAAPGVKARFFVHVFCQKHMQSLPPALTDMQNLRPAPTDIVPNCRAFRLPHALCLQHACTCKRTP